MSLTHILLFILIAALFFSPTLLPRFTRSLGEGIRNLKKGSRGENDIDVTDTVKHLDKDK